MSESNSAESVIETSKAKYTLAVGEAGRERLGIINALYNPSTQAMLELILAQGGREVLEVACGRNSGGVVASNAKPAG
jgi:hypothetical protein